MIIKIIKVIKKIIKRVIKIQKELSKKKKNVSINVNVILIVLFLGVLTISIFLVACDKNLANADDEILTANDTIPVSLANTYYITYVLDGGTNSPSNPTSVQSTDSAFYLRPATKSGYKFLGWTTNSSPDASPEIWRWYQHWSPPCCSEP